MNRAEVLDAARLAVTVDRARDHGDLEDNFTAIAQLWTVYLGHLVRPHDVAAMMALFKVARIRGNPAHADSWVDLAGYAACGSELARD